MSRSISQNHLVYAWKQARASEPPTQTLLYVLSATLPVRCHTSAARAGEAVANSKTQAVPVGVASVSA